MATEYGISIAQQGVPVDRAADYQKVLDSRWRFLEVELEVPYTLAVPSITNSGSYYQLDYPLIQHSLGFVAPFEISTGVTGDFGMYSDRRQIFMRRDVFNGSNPGFTVTGIIRVYNLPILEDYEAPKEFVAPASGAVNNVGFRALDGTVPNLGPSDSSPVGYSIDTKKKILSVHKHGMSYINAYANHIANVPSIDLTNDVLNLTLSSGARPLAEWVREVGNPVVYQPGDFTTYPGGLSSATYYTIPVSDTQVKLATSYANAQAGTAVNITSAGSGGFNLLLGYPGAASEDTLTHGVGYPPTYLLANVQYQGNDDYHLGPFLDFVEARVKATSQTLQFKGVQSIFAGRIAYVILKDPAEIAL